MEEIPLQCLPDMLVGIVKVVMGCFCQHSNTLRVVDSPSHWWSTFMLCILLLYLNVHRKAGLRARHELIIDEMLFRPQFSPRIVRKLVSSSRRKWAGTSSLELRGLRPSWEETQRRQDRHDKRCSSARKEMSHNLITQCWMSEPNPEELWYHSH